LLLGRRFRRNFRERGRSLTRWRRLRIRLNWSDVRAWRIRSCGWLSGTHWVACRFRCQFRCRSGTRRVARRLRRRSGTLSRCRAFRRWLQLSRLILLRCASRSGPAPARPVICGSGYRGSVCACPVLNWTTLDRLALNLFVRGRPALNRVTLNRFVRNRHSARCHHAAAGKLSRLGCRRHCRTSVIHRRQKFMVLTGGGLLARLCCGRRRM
jgi:hypothetical protein